ncbi:MAG: hypothetical protein ABGW78_05190 [Pirellulales bacterium]
MLQLCVWNNSFGAKAMKHPGHCALAMGVAGGRPKYYISYWPDGQDPGGNFKERKAVFSTIQQDLVQELGPRARAALVGGATPRTGQTQDPILEIGNCYGIMNTQMVWVKMPDEVIEIPVSDQNNPAGLSEEAMTNWWKLFSSNLGHNHVYQFVSTKINCASVVMAALTVGGARSFVKPDRQFMYYAPNDVTSYVKQLVKRMRKVRNVVTTTPAAARTSTGPTHSVVTVYGKDIPTLSEWKSISRVRIGRRHSQVAAIDRLIEEYWGFGDHWTFTNCTNKSVKLYEILEQIQSHIASKPKSDRRVAVLALGSKILEVIKDKAEDDQAFKDVLVCTVGRELM